MAVLRVPAARILSVPVTVPPLASQGDVVVFGQEVGVALTNLGEGGNQVGWASVDFGPSVYDEEVAAIGADIAPGDEIFADPVTAALSNDPAGVSAGIALAPVPEGQTVEIAVLIK